MTYSLQPVVIAVFLTTLMYSFASLHSFHVLSHIIIYPYISSQLSSSLFLPGRTQILLKSNSSALRLMNVVGKRMFCCFDCPWLNLWPTRLSGHWSLARSLLHLHFYHSRWQFYSFPPPSKLLTLLSHSFSC